MHSENKAGQNRRIGPAMQWAKPRRQTLGERDSFQKKINIEYPSEADQNSDDASARSSQSNRSNESVRAYRRHEHNHSNSDTSGAYNQGATFNKSQQNQLSYPVDSDMSSAWDYYSGSGNERFSEQQWNTPGPRHNWSSNGQTDHIEYNNAHYYDESTYQYPRQADTPNPKARSSDSDISLDNKTKRNISQVMQYLLPIAVVGIILVVGFMASMN